jgi:hypothetical protein
MKKYFVAVTGGLNTGPFRLTVQLRRTLRRGTTVVSVDMYRSHVAGARVSRAAHSLWNMQWIWPSELAEIRTVGHVGLVKGRSHNDVTLPSFL